MVFVSLTSLVPGLVQRILPWSFAAQKIATGKSTASSHVHVEIDIMVYFPILIWHFFWHVQYDQENPSHPATLLLPVAGLDPRPALAEPQHGGLRIEPWKCGTLGAGKTNI